MLYVAVYRHSGVPPSIRLCAACHNAIVKLIAECDNFFVQVCLLNDIDDARMQQTLNCNARLWFTQSAREIGGPPNRTISCVCYLSAHLAVSRKIGGVQAEHNVFEKERSQK